MDIESLYTNIELENLHNILVEIDPYYQQLSKFINTENKFQYLDDIYRQMDGIAMGTNAAPELANIYLIALLDFKLQPVTAIKYYARYLDDLFFIWNDSEEKLKQLIEELQKLIPKIKFSYHYSKEKIDYLDLTIILQDKDIRFHTHQKALNKYGYITPHSCHPYHVFKGWIIAELNRYKKNSSHRIYYQHTKNLFFQRLLDRGYPRRFLIPIFAKHYFVSVPKKAKSTKELIPLVIRYSRRRNLAQLNRILHSDFNLKRLLPNAKFMISWSKSNNLMTLLCTSKMSEEQISIIKGTAQHSTLKRKRSAVDRTG
jgi:hypothetical protein